MLNHITSAIAARATVLKFCADKRGVTALEYALIAALIAVAIVGAVTSLGTKLTSTFNTISSSV